MYLRLLSWCEPNSPIRYPIRRQVRDRPTVGKKVYIQSDRLLCALCSSWALYFQFTALHFYTFVLVPVGDRWRWIEADDYSVKRSLIIFKKRSDPDPTARTNHSWIIIVCCLSVFTDSPDRCWLLNMTFAMYAYVDWHVRFVTQTSILLSLLFCSI